MAVFANASLAPCALHAFYERPDLNKTGVGFVFFFPHTDGLSEQFVAAVVEVSEAPYTLYPDEASRPKTDADIERQLKSVMASLSAPGELGAMLARLAPEPMVIAGYIDAYAYASEAGGLLFDGWMPNVLPASGIDCENIVVSFGGEDIAGSGRIVTYARPNLPEGGVGVALLVNDAANRKDHFISLQLEIQNIQVTLSATATTESLPDDALQSRLGLFVGDSIAQGPASVLPVVQSDDVVRQPLAALAPDVFFHIDEVIRCGGDGVAIMGWMLAKPGSWRAVSLRCGQGVFLLDFEAGIRVARPDVIAAHKDFGFDQPDCGFVVWVPGIKPDKAGLVIEIEGADRRIGCLDAPQPVLHGLSALRRLLSSAEPRFSDVRSAFDRVFGPAANALRADERAQPLSIDVLQFGTVPTQCRFSVIVPVHRRLDFVEYQMALFSSHAGNDHVQFIYVLDDPPRRAEARRLFPSIYERFRVPFTLVTLDRNVGFACASNIGLRQAKGDIIAFLNSDVFPQTPDWLNKLAIHLSAKSRIGAVGPLLTYEDGSVQHRGIRFSRLAEFGDMHFAVHVDKGRRPSADKKLQTHDAITAACLLMRRSIAEELSGFDEQYTVGDFEDTDLCLRVQQKGYTCAVDPSVRMIHLERKSQTAASELWRLNLTLLNAWRHDAAWGHMLTAKEGAA